MWKKQATMFMLWNLTRISAEGESPARKFGPC
jgi:hypothetical protein